jgi:hypothetical protein
MGMTDEFAIGYYFKRLTAIRYVFGWTAFHVARYADLTRAWRSHGERQPDSGALFDRYLKCERLAGNPSSRARSYAYR